LLREILSRNDQSHRYQEKHRTAVSVDTLEIRPPNVVLRVSESNTLSAIIGATSRLIIDLRPQHFSVDERRATSAHCVKKVELFQNLGDNDGSVNQGYRLHAVVPIAAFAGATSHTLEIGFVPGGASMFGFRLTQGFLNLKVRNQQIFKTEVRKPDRITDR